MNYSRQIKQSDQKALLQMDNGRIRIKNTKLQVTRFSDHELDRAKSRHTQREEQDIKDI